MKPSGCCFAVLLACAAFAATAQKDEIKPSETPRVDVRLQMADAGVNHDHSLRKIRKLAGGNSLGGATYVNGFTRLVLEVGTRLETGLRTTAGGERSVWVEGVEVRVGYSTADIFVPSEYAAGTCPYDVVLEHEREHVVRDRALLEDYVERLRDELKRVEWPTRAKPLTGVSEAEGRKQMEAALEKIVKPSLEELKKQREEARAALDTPKTYRAMRRRCD